MVTGSTEAVVKLLQQAKVDTDSKGCYDRAPLSFKIKPRTKMATPNPLPDTLPSVPSMNALPAIEQIAALLSTASNTNDRSGYGLGHDTGLCTIFENQRRLQLEVFQHNTTLYIHKNQGGETYNAALLFYNYHRIL